MMIDGIPTEGDAVIGAARVALVDAMLANAPVKITSRDNGLFHGLALWEAIAIRQCLTHSDTRLPCLIVHVDDATTYEAALSDLVADITFARISETAPDKITESLQDILERHRSSSCILLNGLVNRIPNPKTLLSRHLNLLEPGALLVALGMVEDASKNNVKSTFNFQIGFASLTVNDMTNLGIGALVCFGLQSREFPQEWPRCVQACAAFRLEAAA